MAPNVVTPAVLFSMWRHLVWRARTCRAVPLQSISGDEGGSAVRLRVSRDSGVLALKSASGFGDAHAMTLADSLGRVILEDGECQGLLAEAVKPTSGAFTTSDVYICVLSLIDMNITPRASSRLDS